MEQNIINNKVQEEELYKLLLPQLNNLIDPEDPVISSISNVTAALKDAFKKISWVGFYFLKHNKLYLGPFQGKVACAVIEMGKGVCGTAAENKETIIVEDVHKFPGHIACDSGSKSEIVVPIIKDKKILGVLDLDSYEKAAFTGTDKKYLEKMCGDLTEKLDLHNILF